MQKSQQDTWEYVETSSSLCQSHTGGKILTLMVSRRTRYFQAKCTALKDAVATLMRMAYIEMRTLRFGLCRYLKVCDYLASRKPSFFSVLSTINNVCSRYTWTCEPYFEIHSLFSNLDGIDCLPFAWIEESPAKCWLDASHHTSSSPRFLTCRRRSWILSWWERWDIFDSIIAP